MNRITIILLGCVLSAWARGDGPEKARPAPPTALKPIASTGSGMLLQPPIDLTRITRQDFEACSSAVGKDKVWRPWTSAITPLPSPPRRGEAARALTEREVREIMNQARDAFDAGKSAPVSDIGLVSTHEDVNRKPMYNHVAAFAGPSVNAYLLVQMLAGEDHWGYFSIVQDLATDPPTDYFGDLQVPGIKFEKNHCYKCHSSGPLAVYPAREDLVSDVPLLTAINRHIAEQPTSRIHPPGHEKPDEYGAPLKLAACTKCHDADASRGPLYRVHSYPIRLLVDFGHMPPGRRLKPDELTELKSWLEAKPHPDQE